MLETGLSYFPLITLTVARKSVKRLQPRIINYRSYKILLSELRKEDFVNNDKDFEKFCNIRVNVLNKMLQGRKTLLEVIKRLFLTIDLSKEIMKRSRLRNRFLKDESLENRMLHTEQKNYCVSLL